MMRTEEERVAEDYKATLSELNSTSKPEINALTMLAEENKQAAVPIAACIENQLRSAPNKQKLPVLYLIDSICKNYPNSIYVQLFTQNLVSNFCKVFEVSDEKVRKSLHKLRMTWNTTKIFPPKKLNAIDERVHQMDPNWPVLHKITQQHQHQQHLQHQQQEQQHHQQQQQHFQHHQQQQQHFQPQQQPPHFQQQPQLLLQPQLHLHQPQQLLLPPQQLLIPPQPISISPEQIPLAPQQVPIATQQLPLPPQPLLIQPQPLPILPQQIPITQQQIQLPIQQPPPQQQQQPPKPPQQLLHQHQPLQDNHTNWVKSLYGGKQCSNCSLRFDDNEKYSHHLDWHFRQNLKSDTMFARRKWYYPLDLWVQFREINDDENQDNNNTDSNVNEMLISVNDFEVPTAPASKDDDKNICSVCHESFEKFWAEEEEEWRLRNARLYEDQRVYHPLCLKDYATS